MGKTEIFPWRIRVRFAWAFLLRVIGRQIRTVTKSPKDNYRGKLKLWEVSAKNWATSSENLLMPYANNKGADQPAHPRSLISIFVVHCLDCIISLVSISEISSLYLVSAAELAGLSFTWSQTPEDRFFRNVAQLVWDISSGSCDGCFQTHFALLFSVLFHVMQLLQCYLSCHGMYRKNPKNSDTRKNCCNYSKSLTSWLCHWVMGAKGLDGIANCDVFSLCIYFNQIT